MRTLFAAKALRKAGSKAANRRGLSEKLKQTLEARRQKKAATSTHGAKEAGAANKPKRTRLRKKKA
ncbi:MAG: hypothetical protein ACLP51_13520 [Syntrophobacteraceae bacterium]